MCVAADFEAYYDAVQGSSMEVKGSYTGMALCESGIKIGVANHGAKLKWFVGYDEYSLGMNPDGSTWHNGVKQHSQFMDRDQRTSSFAQGDTVTVILDYDLGTVQFAINDAAVPGVHYISGLKQHGPVYLAVSRLWPGEQVSLIDEAFFD